MRVYLYEKQLEMPGGMTYFPFASGLLVAYAEKHIKGISFFINEPYEDPDVAAFSVSLWNRNYCINKAVAIKQKHPSCRIIFGGPSAEDADLSFVEVIRGEGEAAFLKAVTGIDSPVSDLDDVPSPYLTGVFDGISGTQAIVETNRGCPFTCAYCFWGKGSRCVRFHSMEYVKAEAEWIGAHKIPYVFCADGNFGMFPRDPQIARVYADVKRRYGYPEKFRVCYGKNAEESVFETATILAEAGLCKSVTLSPQTRNTRALENIGRQNIKDDFFDRMQARYEEAGIPVYSELILGLPGETYESFKDGLLQTMRSGNQLFVYLCECLPSTRLADMDYRREHGVAVSSVPLTPAHCRPVRPEEYESIVTATKTMPEDDWKRAAVLSWMVQMFYSFKLLDLGPQELLESCLEQIEQGNAIAEYFKRKAQDVIEGRGRCDLVRGVYFEPEEVMYLKYFGKGGDPVEEVIYARKNNFKKMKEETVCR
jgi:radical SAM superfamily enzyme YgiQ (UPF0313 family)